MYKFFIRPLLFRLQAEQAHNFTFKLLSFASRIPLKLRAIKLLFGFEKKELQQEFLGLNFKNPVGLAAGFDKDARLVPMWEALGFGFVEIGTVTPVAQPGNPKPRMFRLSKDQAVINRMGFNNEGALKAAKRLKSYNPNIVIGGNIGKNKVTPNENALDDYIKAYEALYEVVDYFVVNVSSPNTPGLRDLQEKEPLKKILSQLKERNAKKSKPKPVLLKIAPDLTDSQLDDIVEITKEVKLDGLIATNTTITRENLSYSTEYIQEIGAGGLSGSPLKERSTEVISYLRKKLGKEVLIIGVGGIMSPEDAQEKILAGANLIQLYTGFIYGGPQLIRDINKKLIKTLKR